MASAVVSVSTATDHAIVAAQGVGTSIRVLGYTLVPAASVAVTWKSGSTAKSGAMTIDTPLTSTVPFDCGDNAALNLTLGGAVAVTGYVNYQVLGGPVNVVASTAGVSQLFREVLGDVTVVCTGTITITGAATPTLGALASTSEVTAE